MMTEPDWTVAGRILGGARHAVALTGAGISVESGIPDFRSPDGLWSRFDPAEYATLSCFLRDPEKAWRLYRALGAVLAGTRPNPAHEALAKLEAEGRLAGIVTQNVDGLHQAAGSRNVLEMHGQSSRLHCLRCGLREPFLPRHLEPGPVPGCPCCSSAMKPDVVLFEEFPREMDAVEELIGRTDVLLVVGTSAEVHPAASLPDEVATRGGRLVEFNLAPTRLTATVVRTGGVLVTGPASSTLPRLAHGRID